MRGLGWFRESLWALILIGVVWVGVGWKNEYKQLVEAQVELHNKHNTLMDNLREAIEKHNLENARKLDEYSRQLRQIQGELNYEGDVCSILDSRIARLLKQGEDDL